MDISKVIAKCIVQDNKYNYLITYEEDDNIEIWDWEGSLRIWI